jgi:hypothetical protein
MGHGKTLGREFVAAEQGFHTLDQFAPCIPLHADTADANEVFVNADSDPAGAQQTEDATFPD